jgi:hypothetical protein
MEFFDRLQVTIKEMKILSNASAKMQKRRMKKLQMERKAKSQQDKLKR